MNTFWKVILWIAAFIVAFMVLFPSKRRKRVRHRYHKAVRSIRHRTARRSSHRKMERSMRAPRRSKRVYKIGRKIYPDAKAWSRAMQRRRKAA